MFCCDNVLIQLITKEMSGTLIHQASIAVDYWRIKKCENIKFFFLTHMHADHCEGLTPSWTQPIYCSPMTKELLLNKIQVFDHFFQLGFLKIILWIVVLIIMYVCSI